MRWQTRLRTIAVLAVALVAPGAAVAAPGTQPAVSPVPVAQSGSAAPAGSPLAVNGKVSVCGNRLCNDSGSAVQLRGMSTHGLQWYPQCVTDGSLDALAGDWNADVVRLSMYIQEGGYETDPQRFTALVSPRSSTG